MKPPVTMYTTPWCGYCRRARSLLERLGIPYVDHDVSQDYAERRRIMVETGWPTVPVIFIGDELVGGYDELQSLHDSGQLEARIREAGASP